MTTRLKTFRFNEDVLQKFEGICKRYGDMSWHVNEALRLYGPIQDEPKPVASMPVKAKPAKMVVPAGNDAADSVIDYLNLKAGTNYKYAKASRDAISPRLKDFTVNDCMIVIDKKCEEWLGTDMAKYLRPATLFQASKFEGYLNQITVKESGGCNDILNDTSWADDIYTGIGQPDNVGFAGELPCLEKLPNNEGSCRGVHNELPPAITQSDDREQHQFGFDDQGGHGQGPCD